MPSLFSRIRTRGRSVESRQTPPSQQSKQSRQHQHHQHHHQHSNSPQQNPAKSASQQPRSVSVPPQRSASAGGRSVSSKASLGSKSTATKNTAVSGSKSKSTTSTPAPTTNASHAAVVGARRPSDAVRPIRANAPARYTFDESNARNHASNAPSTQKRLGYESDGNASFLSGETSDGEFVTALDRSPPKLEDMFLAEGMFGRTVRVSNEHDGDERVFDDPPDIIPALDDEEFDTEVIQNASGSVVTADDRSKFDEGSLKEFQSPEWIAFDSANENAEAKNTMHSPLRGGSNQSNSQQQQHQQQQQQQPPQTTGDWDTPSSRYYKNPRLVSPSPSQQPKMQNKSLESPAEIKTNSPARSQQDDLRAWGMQQEFDSLVPTSSSSKESARETPKTAVNSNNGAFGANFFSNGFQHQFGEYDDAFFETGWTDLKNATTGTSKKVGNHTDHGFNSQVDNTNAVMWDGTTSSFSKPKQSQFFEEKKDDTVWNLPSHLSGKQNPKDSSASSKETHIPFHDSPPRNTSVVPRSVYTGSNDNQVVVSFEAFEGLQPATSSSSSSRKVPPTPPTINNGQGNTARTQQSRHRRVPSNGSTNSQQQLQRSQSRKKGGGSVGSNSSAVDQILEQYRQKRLAKQHQQQENASSGGGQSSNPTHTPSNHNLRRSPSSESLSRTIGNLEKSIAAKSSSVQIGTGVLPARTHPQPPQPPQYSQGLTPSPGRASPQSSITNSRVSSGANYQPNLNTAVNEISERIQIHRRGHGPASAEESCITNPSSDSDQFLLANIEATIGPRGVAPDMESLSGRSNRSSQYRHGRSSPRSHLHRPRGDAASVDSRASRNSFRSYRSNISASALSNMSKESQSVANDLFRLEAQLAEVARQQEQPLEISTGESFSRDAVYGSVSEGSMRSNHGITIIGAEPIPRPSLVEVVAPPGKLGILLANKTGERGPTHVSAVRSESVLAGKVHVGDRFVSIDGEDVSGMNSREITAVMARKADYQRVIVFVPVRMNNRAQDWI